MISIPAPGHATFIEPPAPPIPDDEDDDEPPAPLDDELEPPAPVELEVELEVVDDVLDEEPVLDELELDPPVPVELELLPHAAKAAVARTTGTTTRKEAAVRMAHGCPNAPAKSLPEQGDEAAALDIYPLRPLDGGPAGPDVSVRGPKIRASRPSISLCARLMEAERPLISLFARMD